MTRDVFAEKIGISSMYLSQLEKGQRHGSLPLIVRIAETLSVSIDYLIYGNDSINFNASLRM